jgi:hypothetical protein
VAGGFLGRAGKWTWFISWEHWVPGIFLGPESSEIGGEGLGNYQTG